MSGIKTSDSMLGDFRTDSRMLLLVAFALPLGVISAFVAKALLGSLGVLVGQWLPIGGSGLWAMVAMAAMMGGTMRSPLTGMFFLLELTHDLNALPLLLCGSVAALAVTVLLLRRFHSHRETGAPRPAHRPRIQRRSL